MSSLTIRHERELAALDATRIETTRGRLSAFVQRLIAAREDAAKRRVAVYLDACTDERLHGLGLRAHDIDAVRAGTFNGVRG